MTREDRFKLIKIISGMNIITDKSKIADAIKEIVPMVTEVQYVTQDSPIVAKRPKNRVTIMYDQNNIVMTLTYG